MSYSQEPGDQEKEPTQLPNPDMPESTSIFSRLFTAWSIAGLATILLGNILLIYSQQQSRLTQITKQSTPKELKIGISPKIQLQSLSVLRVPSRKFSYKHSITNDHKPDLLDSLLSKRLGKKIGIIKLQPQNKQLGLNLLEEKELQQESRSEQKNSQSDLGFNYRTRAKMQAIINQQDYGEIINKLGKLQQERIQQQSEENNSLSVTRVN